MVSYVISLITPSSSIGHICGVIALVTGATSLASSAKDGIEAGRKLAEAVASIPPPTEAPNVLGTPINPGTQSNEQTQESADSYQNSIFNP